MRFSTLILKNLFRRPVRSVLTLLALSTAVASVVALLGISQGFTRSFAGVYESHAVDIVVSRAGSADRLSSSIDEDFAKRIGLLPGVARTAAVLLETMSLEAEGVYGIPSMGLASDSWLRSDYEVRLGQNDTAINLFDVDSGAKGIVRDKSASDSKTLWLGVHLADRLGVDVDSSVNLFDESYRITGIFKSPSTWENGSMIFVLDELQRMTDRVGQATYINVVLDLAAVGGNSTVVIDSIEALDAKLLPLATSDFVETDTRMQIAGAMAWMTSIIAIVIGSIGTLNTMLMSVMERTKEIGILRAVGWPKRRVVRMILLESCGLAIAASLLGTLLAMGLTWMLAQSPVAKGILSPSVDAAVVLQGFLLAMVIGLLGAIWPAWRAAQLLPTDAFRDH